jgi:hypothetical protein
MPKNLVIIACSIFRYELESLQQKGKIKVPVVYLNSMLHMYPEKLQILLDAKIEQYQNFRIILLFGDCHARMIDYEKNPNIRRSPGINCCEIILGNEKYRKLRDEGAFILLPEWAERWKEAFVDYMGFKTSKAIRPFMGEMHKKLTYIDTGFQKKNDVLFQEISDFLGLPIEVYPSTIDELEKVIDRLIIESTQE